MIELFVLHSWPKYIESKNAVRTFDGSTITPQRLLDMGTSAGFVEEAFHMFKQISRLKLTDEAIGILCSLVVFSPDRQYPIELAESKCILNSNCPVLTSTLSELEEVQQEYTTMLLRYVQRNYAFHRNYMARLLGLMPKLRFFAEGCVPKHAKALDVMTNLAPRLIGTFIENDNNLAACLESCMHLLPSSSSLCKTEP